MVSMLSDPTKVADYLASNCVTETIKRPRSWEYGYWLTPSELDVLDEDEESTMVQCVDNFGAWDDFERYSPCHTNTLKEIQFGLWLRCMLERTCCMGYNFGRTCQFHVLCIAFLLEIAWTVFRNWRNTTSVDVLVTFLMPVRLPITRWGGGGGYCAESMLLQLRYLLAPHAKALQYVDITAETGLREHRQPTQRPSCDFRMAFAPASRESVVHVQ